MLLEGCALKQSSMYCMKEHIRSESVLEFNDNTQHRTNGCVQYLQNSRINSGPEKGSRCEERKGLKSALLPKRTTAVVLRRPAVLSLVVKPRLYRCLDYR